MSHYPGVNSPVRKQIEALIRARLESKCVSGYSWSTAAAADEASFAIFEWLTNRPQCAAATHLRADCERLQDDLNIRCLCGRRERPTD